jgi:pimeloyl-ACP methyl ester carboxylesterase
VTLREPPKQQRAVNLIGRFVGLIVLLALFALLVWSAATNQQAAAIQRSDPLVHAPGDYVDVPQGAIHLLTVGEGSRRVLFLHHDTVAGGAPLVSLAERLAEADRRVILPDMLGLGFSSRAEAPGRLLSTTGQAESVAALLDEVGGGPVEVVGFARGGEVATELAVLRPNLTERLVLVDTPELPIPQTGLESLEALPFGVGEAVAYTYHGAALRAERRFQDQCPSWAECADDEVLERYRRAASVPGTAQSIRARRASDPVSLGSSRLQEITVPVMVVAVDMDRSEASELADLFPEGEAMEARPDELAGVLSG